MRQFYLLMAVYMNITFRDVTPWISLGRYHHTGGINNLCIQRRRLIQQCTLRMEQLVPSKCWYLFFKLRDLTSQDSIIGLISRRTQLSGG